MTEPLDAAQSRAIEGGASFSLGIILGKCSPVQAACELSHFRKRCAAG